MKIVFFKKPKIRQFNYKPLYYDPEKEEAEERRKARLGLQSDDPRERMRSEIRRKWHVERTAAGSQKNIFRIFFYFIFAFVMLYVIFFTDLVNNLVSIFLR